MQEQSGVMEWWNWELKYFFLWLEERKLNV